MDYQAEINANNVKIAELKARLAELQGQGALGTDEMDYRLAAQRANAGDMTGARYHMDNVARRDQIERMGAASAASEARDLEYQYAKLQDAVLAAEDEKNYVPPTNTSAARTAQRKLDKAKTDLAIFEKKNPNIVKMHWNWAGQKPSAADDTPRNEYNIATGKSMIGDLVTTGSDGNVYLKEGADIAPAVDYFKKIPYWWENEEVLNNLKYLNSLKTPQGAADASTVENAEIFKLDPAKFSNGLWVDEAARDEAKARYDAFPVEQKNRKEAMEFKKSLSKWTKAEYRAWKKAMNEEGQRLFDSLASGEHDIANYENAFTDKGGRKWTRKDGKWETDSTWRK